MARWVEARYRLPNDTKRPLEVAFFQRGDVTWSAKVSARSCSTTARISAAGLCRIVRRGILQRIVSRLGTIQRMPEEFLLAQHYVEALRREIKELEQLLLGKEMPVAADDGDFPDREQLVEHNLRL